MERQTQQVDQAGTSSAQQCTAGAFSVSQCLTFIQNWPCVLAGQVRQTAWFLEYDNELPSPSEFHPRQLSDVVSLQQGPETSLRKLKKKKKYLEIAVSEGFHPRLVSNHP